MKNNVWKSNSLDVFKKTEDCRIPLSLFHVHVGNFHLKGKFFNSETCPLHPPKNWNHRSFNFTFEIRFEKLWKTLKNLTSSRKPNVGILTFCGGLVSSFAAFARQGKKQCCASGKMKRRERERREAAKLEWRRPSDFCSVEIGRREIRSAALRSACGNDARSSLFCRRGGLKRLKLDAHQFLCPCCLWVSRPERD